VSLLPGGAPRSIWSSSRRCTSCSHLSVHRRSIWSSSGRRTPCSHFSYSQVASHGLFGAHPDAAPSVHTVSVHRRSISSSSRRRTPCLHFSYSHLLFAPFCSQVAPHGLFGAHPGVAPASIGAVERRRERLPSWEYSCATTGVP